MIDSLLLQTPFLGSRPGAAFVFALTFSLPINERHSKLAQHFSVALAPGILKAEKAVLTS